MQAIIRGALCGRKGSAAFFASITAPSALSRGVIGMTNNIAFIKLSAEATGRIGTTARRASSGFHTCLMTEEAWEIQ